MTVAEPGHIFHIALTGDREAAKRVGEYRMSTRGKTLDEVGFIHGSFRHQVERIGSLLYAGVSEPVTVLEIDLTRVRAPVRVENLEGNRTTTICQLLRDARLLTLARKNSKAR